MKISVLIASYNYAHYITESIDSIISQTYKDWEIIIVDDGSTDNSVDVIKNYTEKYDNIKLYTHENGVNKGLNKTLQLGLSKCNGEYIAFLESDDYWSVNYLEEKINIIKNNPDVEFIFNGVEIFGCGNYQDFKSEENDYYKDISKNFLYFNVIPTFSCVFLKKNLITNCNFDNPFDPWIDWWLWAQISCKTNVFFFHKKLTYWRKHPQGYIEKTRDACFDNKGEFYKKLYKSYLRSNKYSFTKKFFIIIKIIELNPILNKLFRPTFRRLDALFYKMQ